MDDYLANDYSTADIESLLDEIPRRLGELGVGLSPVAPSGFRKPDALFTHPEATLSDVLELIGMAQPRVVFLVADAFDAASIVESDVSDAAAVETLRRQAASHDGELYGLTMTWSIDGLLCAWFATTAWHDELTDEAEIASEHARGLEDLTEELQLEQRREQFARRRSLILDDPSFRAVSVGKRTTAAKAILVAHGDSAEDGWTERILLQQIRDEAKLATAQHEMALGERVDEIALAILDEGAWQGLRSIGQQRTATAQFILRYSDGWMLSDAFTEHVRDSVILQADQRRRQPRS